VMISTLDNFITNSSNNFKKFSQKRKDAKFPGNSTSLSFYTLIITDALSEKL